MFPKTKKKKTKTWIFSLSKRFHKHKDPTSIV